MHLILHLLPPVVLLLALLLLLVPPVPHVPSPTPTCPPGDICDNCADGSICFSGFMCCCQGTYSCSCCSNSGLGCCDAPGKGDLCKIDPSCINLCGNDIIDPGEECEAFLVNSCPAGQFCNNCTCEDIEIPCGQDAMGACVNPGGYCRDSNGIDGTCDEIGGFGCFCAVVL